MTITSEFAGFHAVSGRKLVYGDDDAEQTLAQRLREWAGGKTRARLQKIIQEIMSMARDFDMPDERQLEHAMLMRRRAVAAMNDQGVLVHDQIGPRRQLLFSIATPGPVPAATKGIDGTEVASGAPQKPFQPHRMIIGGTNKPTSKPGGTDGLLLTALFVGSDLQLVNVPGGQSGIPVEFFGATTVDAKFRFDAAYPAIGITLNVGNPTPHAASRFCAVFVGDAIS